MRTKNTKFRKMLQTNKPEMFGFLLYSEKSWLDMYKTIICTKSDIHKHIVVYALNK